MSTLRQLTDQLDNTKSIKLITQALGDIATLQIKATRKSVQQNILYFQEISQVYRAVKLIARKNQVADKSSLSKNGKTVLVLTTSNNHFNGGLDSELVGFYLRSLPDFPDADKILIGNLGIKSIDTMGGLSGAVQKLTFVRDFPTLEELGKLSDMVNPYSRVLVFHSKFETLLSQKPVMSDISETDDVTEKEEVGVNYILEPEIGKMLSFFQSQILILLFQAIFLDADIARTAARMVSMNQAEDNAEKLINSNQKDTLRLRKNLINRRILESFAGMQRRN